MLQFALHPLSSVLLCWNTLTDFVFFILKWEMLILPINSLDLFDMEAPVYLVFLKHIIQMLNYIYLMVLFLMKIRPCWQIVFQFKFFPPYMIVIIVIIGMVFVPFVECWLYEHLIKELLKSELVVFLMSVLMYSVFCLGDKKMKG